MHILGKDKQLGEVNGAVFSSVRPAALPQFTGFYIGAVKFFLSFVLASLKITFVDFFACGFFNAAHRLR